MKPRKIRAKRSPIWKISREQMIDLISRSNCIGDVLAFFGLQNKGSNFRTLIARFKADDIDYSKFKKNKGQGWKFKNSIPLSECLVEDSKYSRTCLKKRLIKEGLLKEICYECGMLPLWRDKKLVLILDHVNGVFNDNRLENLRLLCPNCNSQTNTFAGRKLRIVHNCIECGKQVGRRSNLCLKCSASRRRYNFCNDTKKSLVRPPKEILSQLLWSIPSTQIAKQFGVSDTAVKKWARSYGLQKPTRGYWSKKQGRRDLNSHDKGQGLAS